MGWARGLYALPEDLQNVVDRMIAGRFVYGFELELLADYISR